MSVAITFGAGTLGLGVGIVASALWITRDSSIKDQCELRTDGKYRCPPYLADDIDSAKTAGKAAFIGFIVAGVGLSLGAVLWATDSTPAATTLSAGPGSVTLRGTF